MLPRHTRCAWRTVPRLPSVLVIAALLVAGAASAAPPQVNTTSPRASTTPATSTAPTAPFSATTLLAKIALQPPASTPFVQVSYRGVLDRPLIVSGTMQWLDATHMRRVVDKPHRAVATVDANEITVQRGHGRVHHMPLSRAPQAAAMLAGFHVLLGGDAAALQKDFDVSAQGDTAHWVVTLAPRSDAIKHQLASMEMDGSNDKPRCLIVNDANGDTSITLVGDAARAGLRSAAPLQSALAARCRNGG